MSGVLNYQAETRRCGDCKYHHWFLEEYKRQHLVKYGEEFVF